MSLGKKFLGKMLLGKLLLGVSKGSRLCASPRHYCTRIDDRSKRWSLAVSSPCMTPVAGKRCL
jgi:hypothetical protein